MKLFKYKILIQLAMGSIQNKKHLQSNTCYILVKHQQYFKIKDKVLGISPISLAFSLYLAVKILCILLNYLSPQN